MNFEDLKDRLKDLIKSFFDKVMEQESFQKGKDRFDQLPQQTRQFLLMAMGLTLVFLIFLLPYGTFKSGSESLANFEELQSLTRGLKALQSQSLPQGGLSDSVSIMNLRGILQSSLSSLRLVTNLQGPEILSSNRASNLIPNKFALGGWTVRLKKLNLKQVKEAGFLIATFHPNAKLTNMKVLQNTENPRYLDVECEVTVLGTESSNTPSDSPPTEVTE